MLDVQSLTKTFGDFKAVDDVSFTVAAGETVGMIGQNGSGKTTIFRLILDFLTPEAGGSVNWNHEPLTLKVANQIGYLPEERGLYDKLTVEDQIIYFARLRGMEKSDIVAKIDEWMDAFEVKGKKTDKIRTLSKGNQQKVQLIATLIHEPKLIILDEPFSGLDPVNADLLKQGIRRLKDQGSAIIFSSHNMNNVEELCDRLVMIDHGRRVLYGNVQEVRESFGRTKLFIESANWTQEELASLEGVRSVEILAARNQYLLHLSDESYGPGLFDRISQGHYLPIFSQQTPTLEEIFKMKAGASLE